MAIGQLFKTTADFDSSRAPRQGEAGQINCAQLDSRRARGFAANVRYEYCIKSLAFGSASCYELMIAMVAGVYERP